MKIIIEIDMQKAIEAGKTAADAAGAAARVLEYIDPDVGTPIPIKPMLSQVIIGLIRVEKDQSEFQ